MYRIVYRRGLHLLGWILDVYGWWNGGCRYGLYRNGERVGSAVLQWRDMDYSRGGHGMYRGIYRRRLYLYGWFLGGERG